MGLLGHECPVSQCSHAGITFCPLVIEAVGGGLSEALRSVVSWIACESNRNSSISHSDTSFKIAAHLMRPSRKRARDLETGSRTDRASLQLPESVSIVRVCTLTSSSHPNFVPGSVPGSVRVCFLCFCVCLKVSGRSWQWQVLITKFAAVFLFVFFTSFFGHR